MQFPFPATDTAQGLPQLSGQPWIFFSFRRNCKALLVHENVDFGSALACSGIELGELETSFLIFLNLSFPVYKPQRCNNKSREHRNRNNACEALSHLLHKCQQLLCPLSHFLHASNGGESHGTRMTDKHACPSSVSQREGTMLYSSLNPPKEPRILLNERHVDWMR